MQNFAFIDETLDSNLTHTYNLSIQASLNGLSFCILDPVTNKFIAFSNQVFEKDLLVDDAYIKTKELFETNSLLQNSYKSVKLIWLSNENMVVPEQFFNIDNLKSHYSFNHKLDDLDELHYQKLKFINAYSVFTIPNLFANHFTKQFPKIKFYNQQQPFINALFLKNSSEQIKISANILNSFLEIAIYKKDKLLLINNYKFKTDSDIAYYILLLYDQYNLNGEFNELVLNGYIDKSSKAYLNLKKYIKHIHFDHYTEDYIYSYTFNKIPPHWFSNLFNLEHCE